MYLFIYVPRKSLFGSTLKVTDLNLNLCISIDLIFFSLFDTAIFLTFYIVIQNKLYLNFIMENGATDNLTPDIPFVRVFRRDLKCDFFSASAN